MRSETVLKLAAAALVLFLLLPVLPKIRDALKPNPPTFERVEQAFRAAGMSVDVVTPIEPPAYESVASVGMYVNGVSVLLCHYDNEGKIAMQLQYQQPGAGSAAVEAMGIAQSLGARSQKPPPFVAVRNGMYMLVAMGNDKEFNQRLAAIFGKL